MASKHSIKTRDNTSIALNYDQNSCILVACDNMYTMELKDEFVFVNFFFHPNFLSFVTKLSHGICFRRFSCKMFLVTKN
jgi:hypothetical protein